MAAFRDLFRTSEPKRDNFLARVLGLFSEDIVRLWCQSQQSPYDNIGRPCVRTTSDSRGHTLDFTLRSKVSGKCYVAEMKAEVAFCNYRYLTLEQPGQLDHHTKPAFKAFLAVARDPGSCQVTVPGPCGKRCPQAVEGAILVWSDMTLEGKSATCQHYRFADVLALSQMICDLASWRDASYEAFLDKRRGWCAELFAGLGPAKQ